MAPSEKTAMRKSPISTRGFTRLQSRGGESRRCPALVVQCNPQDRTVEMKVARLATRAHGVVTRIELLAAGITPDEIRQRMRRGALIPVYRGVYRVGHRAPGLESDYMAAVRACGQGAVLGDRAAGHLLYLLRGRPPAPAVIAPTERRVKGVAIRRCRQMDPREVTIWRGIPVTTVARTLVDLAASSPWTSSRAHVTRRESVMGRRPRSRRRTCPPFERARCAQPAPGSARRRPGDPEQARGPLPRPSPQQRARAARKPIE